MCIDLSRASLQVLTEQDRNPNTVLETDSSNPNRASLTLSRQKGSDNSCITSREPHETLLFKTEVLLSLSESWVGSQLGSSWYIDTDLEGKPTNLDSKKIFWAIMFQNYPDLKDDTYHLQKCESTIWSLSLTLLSTMCAQCCTDESGKMRNGYNNRVPPKGQNWNYPANYFRI